MKSADLIDAGNWIRPREMIPSKDTPLILLVKVAETGGYNRDEKIRVHRICRGTWGRCSLAHLMGIWQARDRAGVYADRQTRRGGCRMENRKGGRG